MAMFVLMCLISLVYSAKIPSNSFQNEARCTDRVLKSQQRNMVINCTLSLKLDSYSFAYQLLNSLTYIKQQNTETINKGFVCMDVRCQSLFIETVIPNMTIRCSYEQLCENIRLESLEELLVSTNSGHETSKDLLEYFHNELLDSGLNIDISSTAPASSQTAVHTSESFSSEAETFPPVIKIVAILIFCVLFCVLFFGILYVYSSCHKKNNQDEKVNSEPSISHASSDELERSEDQLITKSDENGFATPNDSHLKRVSTPELRIPGKNSIDTANILALVSECRETDLMQEKNGIAETGYEKQNSSEQIKHGISKTIAHVLTKIDKAANETSNKHDLKITTKWPLPCLPHYRKSNLLQDKYGIPVTGNETPKSSKKISHLISSTITCKLPKCDTDHNEIPDNHGLNIAVTSMSSTGDLTVSGVKADNDKADNDTANNDKAYNDKADNDEARLFIGNTSTDSIECKYHTQNYAVPHSIIKPNDTVIKSFNDFTSCSKSCSVFVDVLKDMQEHTSTHSFSESFFNNRLFHKTNEIQPMNLVPCEPQQIVVKSDEMQEELKIDSTVEEHWWNKKKDEIYFPIHSQSEQVILPKASELCPDPGIDQEDAEWTDDQEKSHKEDKLVTSVSQDEGVRTQASLKAAPDGSHLHNNLGSVEEFQLVHIDKQITDQLNTAQMPACSEKVQLVNLKTGEEQETKEIKYCFIEVSKTGKSKCHKKIKQKKSPSAKKELSPTSKMINLET